MATIFEVTPRIDTPATRRSATKSGSQSGRGERSSWGIGGRVVALRRWGSDKLYKLKERTGSISVGAERTSDIFLNDETVSRRHARLSRGDADDHWSLLDLRSKNGIRADGIRQHVIRLEAGMVVHVGDVRLVAESKAFANLRCYVCRLLGWGQSAMEKVDEALQELRTAQLRRDPIVFVGEGDLAPVLRDLSCHLFGKDAPFVVSDPNRLLTDEEDVRRLRNEPILRDAAAAGVGGTVFLRSQRIDPSFPDVVCDLRDPRTSAKARQVQFMIGGPSVPAEAHTVRCAAPIIIPSLSARGREVEHVISEYYEDAMREFEVRTEIPAAERTWIHENCSSLADVGKASRRVLALRLASGNLAAAAARLEMAPVSLRRWLRGRNPPPMTLTEHVPGWVRAWRRVQGQQGEQGKP